ncbi:hypothetical protein HUA74_35300 [Myxococcus sp. CA051A]|uniref:hypothetical protein n=1 Tax=Myxococcus sp. CA051A TaxID=2741739 RepID=UPI00157B2BD4|nr:hypothetical protein [Myxococcus sp. CA051A]NTX65940.1 hypothetical protein [Myxococcus sp. CA051A]
MTRDIAAELAAVLESAGLGLVRPPVPEANLFVSPMPEADDGVPDRAVALVVTGGAGPLLYLGINRATYLSAGCQVRIRSSRDDFQGGQALALEVLGLFQQTPNVVGTSLRTEEGAPVYLGADQACRYLWILNLRLGYAWVR